MGPATEATSSRLLSRRWGPQLAVVLLGLAAYLPFLGQTAEVKSNEIRHSEIAREMVATGDYLRPQLLGRPYYDKPPIFHVLVAAADVLAGGPGLTQSRLPSALAAILAALVLHAIAARLAHPRVALAAALGLLAIPGHAWNAHVARPDSVFALTVLAACHAGLRAMRSPRGSGGLAWSLGCGVWLGIGLICKGPLALLFVLLFLVAIPKADGPSRWLRGSEWGALAAGTLAGAGLWVAPLLAVEPGYLTSALTQPDLPWGEAEPPEASYFEYVDDVLVWALPLTLFLPWLLRDLRRRAGWSPALVVFLVWFVALSVIDKKRGHYVLPLYPFLVLALVAAVERRRSPRLDRALWVAIAVGLLATPVRYFVVDRTHGAEQRAKLALAETFMARVPSGAPVVCYGKLGYTLAFEGQRSDVQLAGDVSEIRLALDRAQGRGYLVAPSRIVAELETTGAELEVLERDEAYSEDDTWLLVQSRPRALQPPGD